jgi:hypothetical protein
METAVCNEVLLSNCNLPGYDNMHVGRWVPMFWRNILSPYYGQKCALEFFLILASSTLDMMYTIPLP